MKKYIYFLAIASVAFASCTKLPVTTPDPKLSANGTGPVQTVQTLAITLQPTDYATLTSGYPKTAFSFNNVADAQTYIPQILNSEYSTAINGSTAAVTYNTVTTPSITVADSLYNDDAYTLTAADYTLLPGNNYTDFSIAQLLTWLPYKYPAPVANQLKVLTYNYYQSGVTASAGVATVGSVLYLNNAWHYIYTISPAQYTALGRGTYGEIVATDNASLPQAFNTLLKADPTITDTIKAGDVVYVSYKYYASKAYQRVLPLVYNGTDYVKSATAAHTLSFVKSGGTWGVPNTPPSVNHTLNAADETLIANSTVGGTALATYRGYVSKYGDFDVGTNEWTLPLIDQAFILVLQADYPTPTANEPYNITYNVFTNSVDVPTIATFIWDGTTWTAQQ